MKELSFDQFTKKIYLKAPLPKIYASWGTPNGICSWFLRSAIYNYNENSFRAPAEQIKPGDRYIWEWHNWDGQEKGVILKANGIDYLEFTFASVSKVSVSIEKKGPAVLLTLKQFEIPTDEKSKLNIHHGCSNGWTFWLANLKAYLEHGILLNETEFDLTKIPLAGFEFVNM